MTKLFNKYIQQCEYSHQAFRLYLSLLYSSEFRHPGGMLFHSYDDPHKFDATLLNENLLLLHGDYTRNQTDWDVASKQVVAYYAPDVDTAIHVCSYVPDALFIKECCIMREQFQHYQTQTKPAKPLVLPRPLEDTAQQLSCISAIDWCERYIEEQEVNPSSLYYDVIYTVILRFSNYTLGDISIPGKEACVSTTYDMTINDLLKYSLTANRQNSVLRLKKLLMTLARYIWMDRLSSWYGGGGADEVRFVDYETYLLHDHVYSNPAFNLLK